MPQIVTHSSANPEFPRVVQVAKLRGADGFDFDLAPTPAESAAIATLMGAVSLRKLRFRGRLVPAPKGAWRLEAELGATVVQTCVVTLDPVTTRIDAPVVRLFSPDAAPASVDIVIGELDDDETEPLEDRIDLGLVAIEALALALPPYPRREDAAPVAVASAPPGAEVLHDEAVKPFAALAALRSKLGEGS